tara:strand:- start:22 stop:543 length:522 start_codon:yes stop_codon:yes gene_type:complete
MSKFTGVWAIFEYLDETTETIEQIRKQGVQPTVITPCPKHEIDHALGEPTSLVPWIALAFGTLGCFIGYSLPAWTASDWVLPVSGKPIVAIPPFTIIGFELTILFTTIFTLLGLFLLGFIDTLRFPIPKRAKKYRRFQRDRFGVVVRCDETKLEEFESIMKKNGAEEVHVEKE